MAKIPRLKIVRYPLTNVDGSVSYTGEDITKSVDMNIKAGVDMNKDTFDFKLKSYRDVNTNLWDSPILKKNFTDNVLNKGEFVSLYGWYGAIEPTDDELDNNHLLLHGVINTFDSQGDAGNVGITVKGANSTEELLNTMVPFSSLSNSGKYNTAPKAIKFMITQRAKEFNKKRPVYGYLTTENNPYTGLPGNISATKLDGSAFPTIDYAKVYTPLFQQIELLSTTKYTEDVNAGTYQFYIKPVKVIPSKVAEVGAIINVIVWKPKSLIKQTTLVEGKDFTASKLSWDIRNIYNAFIYNAGTDWNGVGIVGVAYNADSMGKYGAKWKYYTTQRQKFSDLAQIEKSFGLSAGSTWNNETPYSDQTLAGSSWTFSFEGRNTTTGVKDGSTVTASTAQEFNTALRTESDWAVKKDCEEIAEKNGEPRFKVNVELPLGSNSYQMGDLYELQIPSMGWNGTDANPGYHLRLTDTHHKFSTTGGWSTTLTLDEDEYTISQQIN